MTNSDKAPRLGLFGGSFDPVHLGHLHLAQEAVKQAELDRLYFIPARRNPHKSALPQAAPQHRLAMLRLAIAEDKHLAIWPHELTMPAPSYTVDTVIELKNHFPQAELFWLIGADSLVGLNRWHRIKILVGLVTFLVLPRAGCPRIPSVPIANLRLCCLDTPLLSISATAIRQNFAKGGNSQHHLSSAVYDYIVCNRLYQ